MNYTTQLISYYMIPSNVYLHGKNDNYTYIHMYNFTNGLKFIIGTNNSDTSIKDVVEAMDFTIDIVLKYSISAYELQLYYQDYLDIFYSYKECTKIFDYYTNNEHLIREVIEYYTEY